MSRPGWVEVGRVRRPHGVGGEVQVADDTDNPERFVPGAIVYAGVHPEGETEGETRRALEIERVRGRPGRLIVSFRGVSDREQAATLRGTALEVAGTDLPELDEGEYYPFELEGMEARSLSGDRMGRISEIVESPAHAILLVRGDSGELLVPFTRDIVPVVDEEERVVLVQTDLLRDYDRPARGGK